MATNDVQVYNRIRMILSVLDGKRVFALHDDILLDSVMKGTPIDDSLEEKGVLVRT